MYLKVKEKSKVCFCFFVVSLAFQGPPDCARVHQKLPPQGDVTDAENYF